MTKSRKPVIRTTVEVPRGASGKEAVYLVAAALFIEAKKQKDPEVYKVTKAAMRKARAEWREERLADDMAGVVVEAETIAARAAVNNG